MNYEVIDYPEGNLRCYSSERRLRRKHCSVNAVSNEGLYVLYWLLILCHVYMNINLVHMY